MHLSFKRIVYLGLFYFIVNKDAGRFIFHRGCSHLLLFDVGTIKWQLCLPPCGKASTLAQMW